MKTAEYRAVFAFGLLVWVLAAFAATTKNPESEKGAGWSTRYWVQEVGNPLEENCVKTQIAAIDAQLRVTTIDYNQYDSAQSSSLAERVMGLPRHK